MKPQARCRRICDNRPQRPPDLYRANAAELGALQSEIKGLQEGRPQQKGYSVGAPQGIVQGGVQGGAQVPPAPHSTVPPTGVGGIRRYDYGC
ncbi:hypothetical protein EVAR_37693_1 [Eumeta japonica]|uniref:Uncharacterized protein n=1 Tax=Eumeta variegata TaxID=151549 RepID=A0A4C1XQ33_EUMVA|nr:hypothetical protein EVAR_37693_1 [Eumeta japonica]